MIDIKLLRTNPEQIQQAILNKNEKANISEILKLDEEKRSLQFDFESLKAEQNKVSKLIGTLKREKKDATEVLSKMKNLAIEVKEKGTKVSQISNELDNLLLTIPNIPQTDVPIGKDESSNIQIREWSKKKDFDFEIRDHIELAEINELLELSKGAKITGAGFPIHINKGAQLERALLNFMLDFHTQKHNYTEVAVPLIVNRKTMTGTGQLPKLENDMYHINDDDLFLIPTAEVPLNNFYSNDIIDEKKLPISFTGATSCFRREAGSYGKDTKGLQRLHQFNKVEMVKFVKPEKSDDTLLKMVQDAADILEALGLHYRVVLLATGDTSFASAKTYDLEVWAPGMDKYLEVSSVSNFEDFQARRANIRFRNENRKLEFVHTLNGSGLATPRTFIALTETYQNADGTITVPDVLKPYLGRDIL